VEKRVNEEFIIIYMASKSPKNLCVETLPGVFVQDNFEKYLVIKLSDGSSFRDLNAFHVMRDIVKVCGRNPKVMPQADGSLMIEAKNADESNKIKEIENLASCAVTIKSHDTLNQSRGVVYCKDFLRYSEEDLLEGLKDQGVVRVERIKKKIDGVLVGTPTLIVTFDQLTLPDVLQAAYYPLKVKPYVPRPRRCFHCHRFGHVGRSCRRQQQGLPQLCVHCGQVTHGDNVDCINTPCCVNCQGAHAASSTQCDYYKFEAEVISIRTRERVTFAEAKERVRGMYVRPGVSFASALTKQRMNISQPSQDVAAPKAAPVRKDISPSKGTPSSKAGFPLQNAPTPRPKAGPSGRVGAMLRGRTSPPRASSAPDIRDGVTTSVANPVNKPQNKVAAPIGAAANATAHSRAPESADVSTSSPPASSPADGEWRTVGESRKRKEGLASPPKPQKKPAPHRTLNHTKIRVGTGPLSKK
jgi:hypothetical protein